MISDGKLKNDKKNIFKIVTFICGFCGGIISFGIVVLGYSIRKIPPEERELYQIKGYRELNEIQKEDIKMLSGKFGFGDMNWGLFENIEIENLNTSLILEGEVEFTNFDDISFDGGSYQAVEIHHYGSERYEELNLRPESLRRIGTKEVIEIRCKRKGSDNDYFLIIINANKNVYFVPPIEMRTEDDGYIYWVAYSLYSY